MRRSGVRIPLAPPQADIRSGCRFFVCLAWCCGAWLLCCLWRRWCFGRRTCCPVGRAARCARGRRPSCIMLLEAPRVFRAPSGPAAREIATREPKGSEWSISKPARTLRRPPHRRRLRCCVRWHVVSRPALALPPPTGTAARPHRRPPVRSGTLVKPSSPLLARAPSLVKPTAPLRARYTRFRRYFIEQRRRGFHGGVLRSLHWC